MKTLQSFIMYSESFKICLTIIYDLKNKMYKTRPVQTSGILLKTIELKLISNNNEYTRTDRFVIKL